MTPPVTDGSFEARMQEIKKSIDALKKSYEERQMRNTGHIAIQKIREMIPLVTDGAFEARMQEIKKSIDLLKKSYDERQKIQNANHLAIQEFQKDLQTALENNERQMLQEAKEDF